MITIQKVEDKVKEIFPKLHGNCAFHYHECKFSDNIIFWIHKNRQIGLFVEIWKQDTERDLLSK